MAKITIVAFQNLNKGLSIHRTLASISIQNQGTNVSTHSLKSMYMKISFLAHKTVNRTSKTTVSQTNHDTHLLIPRNTVRKSKMSPNTRIHTWTLSFKIMDQMAHKRISSTTTMLCQVNSSGRIQLIKS